MSSTICSTTVRPSTAERSTVESTALHVAVHRERHDARPPRCWRPGPTRPRPTPTGTPPRTWGALKAARRPAANDSDVLWTRIRAIDLFAPLRRGTLVHIPPAYGLGAMRALFGMVDALAARSLVDDRIRARTVRTGVSSSGRPARAALPRRSTSSAPATLPTVAGNSRQASSGWLATPPGARS